MPTNKQRVIGALTSISFTIGGAWVASTIHTSAQLVAKTAFPKGVTATFENIRNSSGNIVVMVFADRDAFKLYDVNKAIGYRQVPANQGTVTVSFPELKHGPLAIAAFHDEDKNQNLNMNGEWPTEGYATSGAVDAYDTPTFRAASIRQNEVSVTMHYAN